jgi:flagellin-like hook-associated protein FlgL
MGAIALSSGVRSNLLSLQTTAQSLRRTQQNLATGNKVNSALDNPANYFTATALRNRAGALNALIDRIGQAQQALHQADNGITALTKLLQSAQSIAQQAKLRPAMASTYAPIEAAATPDFTPQPATVVTGIADLLNATTNVNGMVIRVGGVAYTVAAPPSGQNGIDQIVSAINSSAGLGASGAATASKDPTGHYLVLTSNSVATMTVDVTSQAFNAGLVDPDLVQILPALNGTNLTVQANGGVSKTINFGTAPSQVATYGELQQALAGTNVNVTLQGLPPQLVAYVDGTTGQQNSMTLSGTALAPLGLSAGTTLGAWTGSVRDPIRADLERQYNNLMSQVDQIANDSSYNGNNLLEGNSLTVPMNEAGTSALQIAGVVDTAAGLGLGAVAADYFQTDTNIDSVIRGIIAAAGTLQTQAAQFGGNLSTVTIREDFTNHMIAALKGGADSLVLADANEEGADLLALQTRESLATTALSLSAQSDRNALKLFG